MLFKNILNEKISLVGELKKIANKLKISSSSSRYEAHLRLKCPNGNYENTLKQILDVPFEINSSLKQFSHVYPTFEVTLKDDFLGYSAGSSFYYVPTSRKILNGNALISDKQLTPKNVIDLTFDYTQDSLYKTILKNIEILFQNEDYYYVKEFLKGMCDEAIGLKGNLDIKTIDKTDLTRILKDFGELVSALNAFSTDPKIKYIRFPSNSNEKMVDFYGVNSKHKIIKNFSVKSGASSNIGAAPSMKNIAQFLDNYDDPKTEVFKIMVDKSPVVQKIIDIAKIVDPKAIEILKRIIKQEVTETNLSIFCKENIENLKEIFSDFYSYIKRTFDDKSISKLYSKSLRTFSGFVLSPLGYRIADILNSDIGYKNLINDIMTNLEVIQANIVWRNGLIFSYEELKHSNFKFDFHNNVFLPGNNNFGFKVIH